MNLLKRTLFLLAVLVTGFVSPVSGEELKTIRLVKPRTEGGEPLLKTLAERKSTREFDPRELSPQVLSDLLWAANGVNRSDGRRTAPSAGNSQEIDVYVARKDALYLYEAVRHELVPVLSGDLRPLVGKQDFVKDAPLGLIFVADLEKLRGRDAEFYGATDTGFVSQNVYLFCASEGLATVVLGWVDKPALAEAMKLRPTQRVILTQPVGYLKAGHGNN